MSMQPVNPDKPAPAGLTVGGVTIPPRVAGGGVIAIVALIFILQNRGDITLNFLWFDINAPLWLWLTIMFLAGGIVGWIASRNRIRRKALAQQSAAAG
jgi:putative membrane protein